MWKLGNDFNRNPLLWWQVRALQQGNQNPATTQRFRFSTDWFTFTSKRWVHAVSKIGNVRAPPPSNSKWHLAHRFGCNSAGMESHKNRLAVQAFKMACCGNSGRLLLQKMGFSSLLQTLRVKSSVIWANLIQATTSKLLSINRRLASNNGFEFRAVDGT